MTHADIGKPSEIPVLLTPEDIASLEDGQVYWNNDFYVNGVNPVLEARRSAGRNGVTEAVGALLTSTATSIVHVNTDEIEPDEFDEGYETYLTNDRYPIAFNDHGGGSESHFKILLNGSPEDLDNSYILHSPPNLDGGAVNTRIHKANFTYTDKSPEGRYESYGHVPNPEKAAHRKLGKPGYKYFLFGGPDTPTQVYQAFEQAGFEFVDTPYSGNLHPADGEITKFTLSRQESQARKALSYKQFYFWPGDQFAENLRALGLEVPKLSPTDYPLVRPENALDA